MPELVLDTGHRPLLSQPRQLARTPRTAATA